MRPKSLVLLLMALGCGLVASIGISQVLNNKQSTNTGETEPIMVAVRDINVMETLNPQNVELMDWPKDKVPQGAIRRLEDVKDHRVNARIFQGEPLLAAKLLRPGEAFNPSIEIPKGYRVVAVAVDDVSNNGQLTRPGDRVDVMVYVNSATNKDIPRTGTTTILKDIQVFAVDQTVRKIGEKEDQNVKAKTVSLLVTPDQGQKLALADAIGKIRLFLRRPGEEDVASDSDKVTTLKSIFGEEAGKGNREKEDADQKEASKEANGGILAMVQAAMKGSKSGPAVKEIQNESFSMQILNGPETKKVAFTRPGVRGAQWQTVGSLLPANIEPAIGSQPGDDDSQTTHDTN